MYITGGVNASGVGVEASLKEIGVDVERLAGENRFETAKQISTVIDKHLTKPGPVFIASGSNFPDALAAGPWSAATGSTLVLTDGQFIGLPQAVTNLTLIGGQNVITLNPQIRS